MDQLVRAADARTSLPSLLLRAAAGERFLILKHGLPIARLVPVEDGDRDGPAGNGGKEAAGGEG